MRSSPVKSTSSYNHCGSLFASISIHDCIHMHCMLIDKGFMVGDPLRSSPVASTRSYNNCGSLLGVGIRSELPPETLTHSPCGVSAGACVQCYTLSCRSSERISFTCKHICSCLPTTMCCTLIHRRSIYGWRLQLCCTLIHRRFMVGDY